jgi:hypothetical protein
MARSLSCGLNDATVNYPARATRHMADKVEYRVVLDPENVQSLGRIWRQRDPEGLLQSLFELAYHHYVEEEDELIPGKVLRQRTDELEARVTDLQKKLAVRRSGEIEAKTALCPKCFSKIRYDTITRDYACAKCGWEGPPEEVVRRDLPGST